MKSQHTPGPWRLAEGNERSSNDRQFVWPDALPGEMLNRDGSPKCIATVHERADIAVMEANARLIRAAPDLLALAHTFASECAECMGTGVMNVKAHPGGIEVDGEKPCDQCEDIRAVIAKATTG